MRTLSTSSPFGVLQGLEPARVSVTHTVPARAFRVVESAIRSRYELLQVVRGGLAEGRGSDAGRHLQRRALVLDLGALDGSANPFAEDQRAIRRSITRDHGEFFTAVACEDVFCADRLLNLLADGDEYGVARLMPVLVVEALEVIHIE